MIDPVPSTLPEDTKYLGDRLDKLIGLIEDIEQSTVQQQATPPMILEILSTNNGIGANTDFGTLQNSTRMRVENIIAMCGNVAGVLTLFVGTRKYRFGMTTNNRAQAFPFPIIVDAGVDIKAQHDGAPVTLVGFYLIGYPESKRP